MQTLDAEKKEASGVALEQKKDALTVTDRRTGKSYEIPIADGTIRATDLDLAQIGRADRPVGDRDLVGLPGPPVGHGQGILLLLQGNAGGFLLLGIQGLHR